MKSLRQHILDSPQLNPPMLVADIFPPLDKEVGPRKDLLMGKVLNAGAGNRDLTALARGEVTNQDIPQGLHSANIHIYSPLHEIPREDGYFDVIFCNAVLEHVANPEEVVREFARVCRARGLLYLCVPFMQPEHKDPTDFQRYTADGLIALVQRHGFAVETVEAVHSVYTTLAWMVICWLSASRCLRNVLLNWVLFRPLRYLSRHGREQVFAAASAYRILAVRNENTKPTGPPEELRPDIAVVMALREVAPAYDGPLSRDTALGAAGVDLDSISFFELVLAVERLAGTGLRKHDLDAAALATVGSLADLVQRMRGA